MAFLASLQVVFVPMLSAALGKGSLSARLAAAACLSVSGVALLEIGGLSDLGDSAGAAAPIGATLLALLQPAYQPAPCVFLQNLDSDWNSPASPCRAHLGPSGILTTSPETSARSLENYREII